MSLLIIWVSKVPYPTQGGRKKCDFPGVGGFEEGREVDNFKDLNKITW